MKVINPLKSGNAVWFIIALVIAAILFWIKFTEITKLLSPTDPLAGDLMVKIIIDVIIGMIVSIPITSILCLIFPEKKIE